MLASQSDPRGTVYYYLLLHFSFLDQNHDCSSQNDVVFFKKLFISNSIVPGLGSLPDQTYHNIRPSKYVQINAMYLRNVDWRILSLLNCEIHDRVDEKFLKQAIKTYRNNFSLPFHRFDYSRIFTNEIISTGTKSC